MPLEVNFEQMPQSTACPECGAETVDGMCSTVHPNSQQMKHKTLNLKAMRKRAKEAVQQTAIFELWRMGTWMFQLLDQIKRLDAALDFYGVHKDYCDISAGCTCGLLDIIDAAKEQA